MNVRVWIVAIALIWASGCGNQSDGDAQQSSTPAASAESSLTRYCCDQSLSNCDPEPTKNCADDPERSVINWE